MIATLPCTPYHDGNNASKMGKEGKKQEMELYDVYLICALRLLKRILINAFT